MERTTKEPIDFFWLRVFAALGVITAGSMALHLGDKFIAYLLK